MRHAKNLIAMGHKVLGYDPVINVISMPGAEVASLDQIYEQSDAVIIASPTTTHAGYILDAMQYADMDIFVEKPIGANQSDLDSLREAYSHGDQVMMCGMNLRFHSCVRKAKEWLAEGLIGKPLWASFCVAQHNTKYTDPVILNWGSHECDLALYLLGPAMVTAAAGNDQIMDVCLLHEYGVPSTIHMDYVTRPEQRGFYIGGETGVMSVTLVDRIVRIMRPDDSYLQHMGSDSFDENYKDEMQAFIDLIDGKPVPHAATGQDGLNALELILEAKQMAEK